jgi:outer membrane protein OmpA-like peptidoglycan-associated protein
MAERKAQLAVAIADRNIAENETLALAREKDELLLKVRERQAKTAEADAERLAAEAAKARAEAEKARAQAADVEKALAELKAEKTERGMVLTLGDVLFATGEATLSPGAMMTIEKLTEFMEKYPNRGVVIEGHTDNVGTAEYNMALSSRRAYAVKKALVEKGIAADRIATIGYGETYPKASNDSAAGRQQNRRVEVVILDEGVAPSTYKR